MDNPIDIYGFPPSPPVRAVLLMARALGVIVNFKTVNIMNGDQMKPDYMKMNPMHTIPTMDDNGYVLWESRAILQYLTTKYDKEGKFTTHDANDEGRVDQILFFDGGTIFPRLTNYMLPVMMGIEQPNNEKLSKLEEALRGLNVLLQGRKYAAGGEHLTVADFSLTATVSTIGAVKVDMTKFPNVKQWLERMKKELPGYDEINQKGVDMIAGGFQAKAA